MRSGAFGYSYLPYSILPSTLERFFRLVAVWVVSTTTASLNTPPHPPRYVEKSSLGERGGPTQP